MIILLIASIYLTGACIAGFISLVHSKVKDDTLEMQENAAAMAVFWPFILPVIIIASIVYVLGWIIDKASTIVAEWFK